MWKVWKTNRKSNLETSKVLYYTMHSLDEPWLLGTLQYWLGAKMTQQFTLSIRVSVVSLIPLQTSWFYAG